MAQNDILEKLHQNASSQDTKTKVAEGSMKALYIFFFIWILVSAFALYTSGDCEQPIRLWIKGLLICYIVHVVLVIGSCVITLPAITIAQGFLHIFQIFWYVLGTFWFFKDDTCEAQWPKGYYTALFLVVFFFVSLLPWFFCCLMVCATMTKYKR